MSNQIILFPTIKQRPSVKTLKVPATIRALALALRVRLNITADASLVYMIGNGQAKTNQKAIEKWLLDNYSEGEIKLMSSPLEEITDSLERHLNNKLMIEDKSC